MPHAAVLLHDVDYSAVVPRQQCTNAIGLVAGAVNSLGVVLGQEMQRYNRLLHHVTVSLQQLIKALKVQPHHPCPATYVHAASISESI